MMELAICRDSIQVWRILDEEPRAVFTHCCGHVLLAASDTV